MLSQNIYILNDKIALKKRGCWYYSALIKSIGVISSKIQNIGLCAKYLKTF